MSFHSKKPKENCDPPVSTQKERIRRLLGKVAAEHLSDIADLPEQPNGKKPYYIYFQIPETTNVCYTYLSSDREQFVIQVGAAVAGSDMLISNFEFFPTKSSVIDYFNKEYQSEETVERILRLSDRATEKANE